MQCDDPRHDILDVHRLALAGPLPREVEQRLDHAAGSHRFRVDHLGALAQIGPGAVELENFGKRGDRRERVVELVRHAGHQPAQLRQPVGFQELALQQHFARDVHGEEQQLRRAWPGRDVFHDGVHRARRLTRELHDEVAPLPRRHRRAQHRRQRGPLHRRRPPRQRQPPQRAEVHRPEQGAPFRIGLEDLAFHGEHQRGDRQALEQLRVQEPLALQRREDLRGARLGRQLLAHRAEQQHQLIARTAGHPRLEHHAGEVGRAGRREIGPRSPVQAHLLEHLLHERALRRRKRHPEARADGAVGRQPGDLRRAAAPLDDRPVRGDGCHPGVQAVQQGFGVHTPLLCSS